jgi:hypothetical protein
MPAPIDGDIELVKAELLNLDADGARISKVLRDTLDQLYDGQRTGRYRWDQLYKTEKTHCGTLVEINLQREFDFADGGLLDYQIAGVEVDCKYSQRLGGWTIPPEAEDQVCLLMWADDERAQWCGGLVRATADRLNVGRNRDRKSTLNDRGRGAISWVFDHEALPPNALLQLPRPVVDRIFAMRHGTQRLNELFREAQGMRIGRGVVATVAQQHDYMKRVRRNGGSRTTLKPEGLIILGQYTNHCAVAAALGVPKPGPGESVAVRVAPAIRPGAGVADIEGSLWRVATDADPVVEAPDLPNV